jgi:ATP-dependent Clp protease ATP-binding subunit ClpX
MKNKTKEAQCSFCHKPKSDALLLISGIDGYICETCVEQAHNILSEELELESKKESPKTTKEVKKSSSKPNMITPLEIKNHLDEYVVGQDETKKILAVAVYNH